MPNQLFTSPYPIRFAHTDMAGIVYYPNYFNMFQSVVEDWFDHWLGIRYATLIAERKVALTSVRAACDFLCPTRIGDILDLSVILRRTGRSSITIGIEGSVSGKPALRGEVVLVTLSLTTFKAIEIPPDIAARLKAYQELTPLVGKLESGHD